MTLLDHARYELDLLQRAADQDENGHDDFQAEINRSLLDLVARFAEVGHSGGSAGYAIGMLERLLSYKPLGPLTGAEEEWVDVADMNDGEPLWQNRRCGHVFKQGDFAYDIDAVVFRLRDGTVVSSGDGHRRISFPYVPGEPRVVAWWWRPFDRQIARLRGNLRGAD